MPKLINLKKLTTKTLIGLLMVSGFIAQSSNQQAVATDDDVFGLELYYKDSALQCNEDPTQATINVEVYNQDNDTLITTLSKNEKFTTAEVDSIDDLYLKYVVSGIPDCLTNGSYRAEQDRKIYDYENRDNLPDIEGFNGQSSIRQMLEGFDDYKELLLVELGTSSPTITIPGGFYREGNRWRWRPRRTVADPSYDLQDVVIVVDNNPDTLITTAPDEAEDGDVDNNGILDSNEIDSDIDNDGLKNFEDLDDDGDNIADVYELYTPSQISDTGTKVMVHILDGAEISVTLPNPPAANILPDQALNTDGEDQPDYQDTNTDNDQFLDILEAGDTDLATAPFNSDSLISGDSIADFRDLDSDDNGIIDDNEIDSDVDDNGTKNFQDLDDDGDGIIDLIEIGSNPASPTNSDNSENPDYQDTDSDNDGILDSEEGVMDTTEGTTAVSISYPNGSAATTYNLLDNSLSDTKKDGLDCVTDSANICNMTSTSGTQGTVTITGTMTGLDYQVPFFAD